MRALVLQARLDSSRLPGKSLLPLGGRPLILRVMESFQLFSCDKKILACPEDCASEFAPLAEEAGFELSTGPKDDVLARYCIAIKRFGVDWVFRATGDNPFVLIDAAETLCSETIALGADYGLYSGIPHGTGVECVSAKALLRAEKETASRAEHEHVCPYLYNNPQLFMLHRPLAPVRWQGPELNCTVDTLADYERAEKFYAALADFPKEEKIKGKTIISVYRKLFV